MRFFRRSSVSAERPSQPNLDYTDGSLTFDQMQQLSTPFSEQPTLLIGGHEHGSPPPANPEETEKLVAGAWWFVGKIVVKDTKNNNSNAT